MTTEMMNYIRIGFSILSLAFGVWQYMKRRSIEHLISLEAVELHLNVGKALGAIQGAKEEIRKGDNPNVQIGMTEGILQAMRNESAKLFCNLRNTTIDDINELIKNEQLIEKYKDAYYAYSKRKVGWIRKG